MIYNGNIGKLPPPIHRLSKRGSKSSGIGQI